MDRRHTAEHLEKMNGARVASGRLGGRPQTPPPPAVVKLIVEAVQAGLGWSTIAGALNDDAVPPPTGAAKWWPSSVQRVYRRATGVDPDRPAKA